MDNNSSGQRRFITNVVLKTAVILLVINFLFGVLPAETWLGKVTYYNLVFPGRWRLAWSENPGAAYAISTNNLDALFRSHEVSADPISKDEYRIFFFGDSSVWGFLLPKEMTLTNLINKKELLTPKGRPVRAYNLGYPTISLTKDLLLMQKALEYQPDMIVWFVTLEAFPDEKQMFTPLVLENADKIREVKNTYNLDLAVPSSKISLGNIFERSILGKRRELADLMRLQIYGVLWAGTGIDQDIPTSYEPLQVDYDEDDSFYGFTPPKLDNNLLAVDVLQAGAALAKDIPVLIVNEPIFVSSGENSDIRYNFFYPTWAYDDYLSLMFDLSKEGNWEYLDLWNQIPASSFTNTAIHIDEEGTQMLADLVAEKLAVMFARYE